jgi:predicted thioesterase
MMTVLKPGISHEVEHTVTVNETANSLGSGSLEVYSTPSMIALMERTSMEAVKPYLGDGNSTVGVLVNIRHIKPTPVGSKIKCCANLEDIDGKRLIFNVEVHDMNGLIGSGTHERYIIDEQKFMSKIFI